MSVFSHTPPPPNPPSHSFLQVRSEGQLALEYAARYVEKVGATPTPETMRLVLDNIPLSKCHVNAAWRSRGWLADRLYVNPHHQGDGGLGDDADDDAGGVQGAGREAFAPPHRIDVSTLANIGVGWVEMGRGEEGGRKRERERERSLLELGIPR